MAHSAVIVIGSGSAGLTAALYTARANLAPIVIEGKEPGGQLTWTSEVENFPGFPDGILGPELMDRMKKQAQRFGADCREYEKAVRIDLSQRPFRVTTNPFMVDDESTVEYTADALILASGATARTLGLPEEMAFLKAGLSTCATCDGALYKGKKIAVVGGGDTAVEEATFLTRFARQVTLIHRRDSLRASQIMRDRIFANPKIDYAWNSAPVEYLGEKEPYRRLNGVRLKSTQDGSTRDLELDGLFLAIGHSPNTEVFRDQLAMTPEGYVLNRTALAWKGIEAPAGLLDSMPNYGSATSVEGVFAAGDVVDTHYRQAITAAGAGCAAAIDCEKWLESQHQ
jgi:thioredoxin reductase (NADPH)